MTPVVTTAGTVYFSNPWRRLCAFDSSRGTFLWGGPIQSSLYSSPVLDEQGIIHLCDGLYLYAMEPPTNTAPPAKSPWPMWRANSQHTGRVQ